MLLDRNPGSCNWDTGPFQARGFSNRNHSLMDCSRCWLICIINIHQEAVKAPEIVTFINALFQFHSIHPGEIRKGRAPFKLKLSITLVYCCVLTMIGFPLAFVYGLHWIHPCKATLAGYWAILECGQNGTDLSVLLKATKFSLKILVILINHWLWSITVHAGAFGVSVFHTLSVISVQQIMQRFV